MQLTCCCVEAKHESACMYSVTDDTYNFWFQKYTFSDFKTYLNSILDHLHMYKKESDNAWQT